MITVSQYFGPWSDCDDVTEERRQNAILLLHAVSALQYFAVRDGIEFPDNPHTGSGVSGQTYGGFRPQSCTQGAPQSSHKEGMAVDLYDPEDLIDGYISQFDKPNGDNDILRDCGLYREHPSKTAGWCHLSTRAPGSKKRTFFP